MKVNEASTVNERSSKAVILLVLTPTLLLSMDEVAQLLSCSCLRQRQPVGVQIEDERAPVGVTLASMETK